MIRTMDSRNIQAILSTNARDFGLQPLREGLAEPLFGRGINTTDGEEWQQFRATVNPTFNRVEICNFGLLETHFQRLLDHIPKDGSQVDLQPLFSQMVGCYKFLMPTLFPCIRISWGEAEIYAHLCLDLIALRTAQRGFCTSGVSIF